MSSSLEQVSGSFNLLYSSCTIFLVLPGAFDLSSMDMICWSSYCKNCYSIAMEFLPEEWSGLCSNVIFFFQTGLTSSYEAIQIRKGMSLSSSISFLS